MISSSDLQIFGTLENQKGEVQYLIKWYASFSVLWVGGMQKLLLFLENLQIIREGARFFSKKLINWIF